MAFIKAYEALNMFGPIVWDVGIVGASSTRVICDDYYYYGAQYDGTFTVESDGYDYAVTGGTITDFKFFSYGDVAVTGKVNMNAVLFMNDLNMADGDAAAYSYMLRGNDRVVGSVQDDVLRGGGGADVVNGYNGNDFLRGDAGNDTLLGGAGNDTMIWSAGDSLNGEAGIDTVKLVSENLNLVLLSQKVLDTERVDMRGGSHNTLTLNRADVLEMSSTTNTIKIFGDAGDTVDISGSVTAGAASGGFRTYNLGGGALLTIETDVHVV